jgi:hypothetical protein
MFVHRKVERGTYQPMAYRFSSDEFIEHVQSFVQLSVDFQQAIGLSDEQVAEFAAFALPLSTEAT